MSNQENHKYVFYDYLAFFWKKKWFFFVPPIILLIIAVGLTFLNKPTYLGQSTVYTGSVNKETWKQPDLIEAQLNTIISNKKSYSIKAGENRVYFNVQNQNKDEVSEILNKVTEAYYQEINKIYSVELQIKESELNNAEKKIEQLDNSIKRYKEEIESPSFDAIRDGRYFDLLYEDEKTRLDYFLGIDEIRKDLLKLEEPQILEMNVNASKSYLKSNILVALIFGVFLSFIILTLWKYLEDARKQKN